MQHNAILPPEWAEQNAILLTWPHQDTDWKPYLDDINKTYVQLADAITLHEKLIVVSPCVDDVWELLAKNLTAGQLQKIILHLCPTDDTWTRDHGFITLLTEKGVRRLLDFKFNGWGMKFPSDKDNAINRSLLDAKVVNGEYVDYNDFVLEGGSIETDGNGSLFTTSGCLLAPNRNQPLSRCEIETILKKRLCVDRVLWIDHGKLDGDDTDGHIDTLVRTAPNNTLLYIGCDDVSDSHYTELKLMEEQLKTFRTAKGQPYRLLKLPMATAIYDGNDRLPATYANFIIINGAVIYPTYGQPDNDRKAREILQMAFPERELIGIDSRTLIRQHGSLHCCTMQIAAPKPPFGGCSHKRI
ncbi:MAG: agmatine deiminase family protein [Prevotella sp.]|nr:agmatine deiminase family protein [Prevotella sp.]